jgi:FkbM family methyltransferase
MSRSGELETAPAPVSYEEYLLPNGMLVAHQRDYETRYLYQEIFERTCYLQHGITLPRGAVVLDIGANIGMFSMFVATRCPDAVIHAVEPAPALLDLLRANLARYAPRATAHHCGVSDTDGELLFTYYPNSSVFSGFHTEFATDRAALRQVIDNAARESGERQPVPEFIIEELLDGRLVEQRMTVPTRSVSSLIAELGLDRIDLLKIDAERSEVAALTGVTDEDWPRIRQVALESHGGTEEHELLAKLLNARGFEVVIDCYGPLADTGFANLYARRTG